jgi:flagellar hook protein FlgE
LNLNNLPSPPGGEYSLVNVYRREAGADSATPAGQFRLVGQDVPVGGAFIDDGSADIAAAPELDETTLNGSYTYMLTYAQGGANETRPVALPDGAVNVVNGRIQIQNIPTPPAGYDQVRLYRNLQTSPDSFYLVETLQPGDSYTDSKTDAEISNLTLAGNQSLDMNGPRVGLNTLLTDVTRHDGSTYQQVFQTGTLQFAGRKGDRSLAAQSFEITDTTTVADLLDFMQGALGVQPTNPGDPNPIPTSENQIVGETGDLAAGVYLNDGRIRVVSNNGVDNAVDITSSGMQIVRPDGQTVSPSLSFNTLQEAEGQSTVADFVAYDSLGVPINVRVTAVLESRDGNATTYRWYADSPQNDLASGIDIGLGTGLVQFDGDGNLLSTSNPTLMIARQNIPSTTPLEFELDFSNVSGLASPTATLSASRQDGFPPGTLESFDIGEDGVIRGIFSNGATRDLGQIQIARFANPQGLEQLGQTMFGVGVNSGLPIIRAPGQGGAGSILAGAVELSNTDIGENLTNLILAATQYRGNTRVITTSQQLLDELLNIRR